MLEKLLTHFWTNKKGEIKQKYLTVPFASYPYNAYLYNQNTKKEAKERLQNLNTEVSRLQLKKQKNKQMDDDFEAQLNFVDMKVNLETDVIPIGFSQDKSKLHLSNEQESDTTKS